MGDTAKPEDFFLATRDDADDVKFLAPHRVGNKIEPLVDGTAFFTAVEEAMASAKDFIYCAMWNIYPSTPLVSTKVKSSKLKDWQGLFVAMAKKKVKIRILTSDFDPILDNSHHQRAWKAYNQFVSTAAGAKLTADYFQVFPSMHPASFAAADMVTEYLAKAEIKKTIGALNKAKLKGLENTPGLWPYLKKKGSKLALIDSPSFEISPATYHQKMLVIDGAVGFVGGINVSDFYLATSAHSGNQRTHDIFCRAEGPVVQDVERNFVGRWNDESPRFTSFVKKANAPKLAGKTISVPFSITSLATSKASPGKQGNALAQVHRTVSTGLAGSFPNLTVSTARDDIWRTYEAAISLASEYIYIENQYIRVIGVADAIIKRFKTKPGLQVIVVVPVIPEEVEEGAGDPLTLHGVYLQHETLTKLQAALGSNLGLYSLVQQAKAPTDKRSQSLSSYGSLRIYPHSKVLIVDDVFASIGSANVNPRGFELDGEIDLGWHDTASVSAFREQLWKEHLGTADGSLFATWKVAEYVKEWSAIAKKNTTATATRRQGFIVPHDPDDAKGTKQGVPDFFAGLGAGTREENETKLA